MSGRAFEGMSMPEAVREVLFQAQRPMKVAAIVEWMSEQGWKWGADIPRVAVAKSLQRRENSVGDVERQGNGWWQCTG
jgi:hypothetical protein